MKNLKSSLRLELLREGKIFLKLNIVPVSLILGDK